MAVDCDAGTSMPVHVRCLPALDVLNYTARFPGPHLALVLASIVAGNTAARLWEIAADDAASALLLWDQGNNVFYLDGDAAATGIVKALADLVTAELRPQALAQNAPYFRVQATSSLAAALPAIFDGVALQPHPAYLYADHGAALPDTPVTHSGLTIRPIARDLLAQDHLANIADVRAEIRWMWPSEERFYAVGFGMAALVGHEIVCWCTAEYVGPTACGIGVATVPAYRGVGIAAATAVAFLRAARGRGLNVYWECAQHNLASVRVAEKLGLTRLAAEHYWAGSFVT